MTPAGHIGVRLPAKQAFRVLALQNRIKSADLAEHGRELHPHVTVLGQVNTDDVAAVRRALANRPGGRLRFGSIGVFSNPQHDVLQIEVDSPELRQLHDLLAARLPNQENWPKYQPHVTLAYLKPGAGRKYLELNQLAGEEVDVDRVVFRAPTGQRHYLQLGGAGGEAPLTKAAGMLQDSFLAGYKVEKVADTGVTLPRVPKGPQMARNELYAGADKMNKHAFLAGYMSKEAADPPPARDKRLAARFYQLLHQVPWLEGYRAKVYDDRNPRWISGQPMQGKPTIGYGINLSPEAGNIPDIRKIFGEDKLKSWLGGGEMSQAEAGRYLQHRVLTQDLPNLRRLLPSFDSLPEDSRLGIMSAHYNAPKLVGPNLRDYINREDYRRAVGELAYGHSGDLPGLVRRRILEARLLGRGFKVQPELKELLDPAARRAEYNRFMQEPAK